MALYLVTGGAGFIGSHLTDALLGAGHAVRVLDDLSTGFASNLDARAELVIGDAADQGLVRECAAGCAGIFHLAAVASVVRSNEDWPGTHRANQSATVAVLDAARALGRIPVVYASSAAVYGNRGGQQGPMREDDPKVPATAYGADKLGSELHAAVAWGIHGVPTLGLRFQNVYGPRQDPRSPYSGVISIFADRIGRGLPVTVHGDGSQSRDFVFVADIVRFVLAAMESLRERPRAAVLNAATGRATSVLDLARAVGVAAGAEAVIEFGTSRAGDIRTAVGDPAAASADLGVVAGTALADGLARTVSAVGGRAPSQCPGHE
jgi:UDP-glucose 4-epimerase